MTLTLDADLIKWLDAQASKMRHPTKGAIFKRADVLSRMIKAAKKRDEERQEAKDNDLE